MPDVGEGVEVPVPIGVLLDGSPVVIASAGEPYHPMCVIYALNGGKAVELARTKRGATHCSDESVVGRLSEGMKLARAIAPVRF